MTETNPDYPYAWRGQRKLPERIGWPCKSILVATPGSFSQRVIVEFEDGVRVVTTKNSIRRRMP